MRRPQHRRQGRGGRSRTGGSFRGGRPTGGPRAFRRPHRPAKDYAVVTSLGEDGHLVNISPELQAEYLPALFHRFPVLAGRVPWTSLRGASEPQVPKLLRKTQNLYGENYVYLKQEALDLHIIPENAAKKLEFILGDEELMEARKWVIAGAAGDPFCLGVAKAAAENSKKCEIILRRQLLTTDDVRRIMAMMGLGARVRLRETERAYNFSLWWSNLWSRISRAPVLEEAGATPEGVLGYVSALMEVAAHHEGGDLPSLDYLVVPVGSGAALAGFEIGRQLLGWNHLSVVGVVGRGITDDLKEDIQDLMEETWESLREFLPDLPSLNKEAFQLDESLAEKESLQDDWNRWIIRFLEVEQIEMDLEHSGRALLGLHRMIESKKIQGKKILFWNTSSSFRAGDLGQFDGYQKIPKKLKRWIREEQKNLNLAEIGRLA